MPARREKKPSACIQISSLQEKALFHYMIVASEYACSLSFNFLSALHENNIVDNNTANGDWFTLLLSGEWARKYLFESWEKFIGGKWYETI